MDKETRHYLVQLLSGWPDGPPPGEVSPAAADEARAALLAHRVAGAVDHLVPKAWRDAAWQTEVAQWLNRSGFLLMELERILPTLTRGDCRPVVLKGAALACGHYRDPLWRQFLDLDILVPRDRVEEATKRLIACGYEIWAGPRDPLYYDRYHLHRILRGPQGSLVEIHWDLTMPGSVYGFDVAGVFDRAVDVPVGRTTLSAAAAVDQVLHSVYQHIADGFVDLKRILDLKVLLQTLPEGDWLYLVKESERTQMGPALKELLYIMKELTGLEVPDQAASLPGAGPVSGRVLRGLDLPTGLLERRAAHSTIYLPLLHFLLVPGLLNKVTEYGKFLWPGEARLLARGYWHDQLPGPAARLRLALYNLKLFAGLCGQSVRAWVRG